MKRANKTERIRQPRYGRYIFVAILAIVVFLLIDSAYIVTYENQYTLVKQFGKVEKIVSDPGLSLKIPFIQTTDTLPKSIQIYDLAASDVITEDKKSMVADCYVLWRIKDPKLFVQTLNSISNAESRINITVYNAIKTVISSMVQSSVITGRDGELSRTIMAQIGNTMDQYGIDLLSVETKHMDLPNDNKNDVYERMISERNNKAATFTAEGDSEATKIHTQTDYEITISVSEAEAKGEKIVAEGEAEYMRILSEAYADEGRSDFYSFVISLDAAKAALKGSGKKTLILDSDSPIAKIFENVQ
ncbi:MAG: protease modulator HflC [Lachnospiraceae bacterium]|nr:protease modulator HflC [Lachnospiraceae bacterium]